MGRHLLLPSPDMERSLHLWAHGHFGSPVVVFPTAAGSAHEWEHQGMLSELQPLLEHGRIKLYCVESNVSEAWTCHDSDPRWRIRRHQAYERFVLNTLVPFVRADCRSSSVRIAAAGCSLGAMYAANMALKHPEIFWWSLCMSGRYEVRAFTGGLDDRDVYLNNPLAYTYNLEGEALQRARGTSLTLVCGQGQWEDDCIEETIALAEVLQRKQIPCERDLWGHEVSHEWPWWRRQARHHLERRLGGVA
ncbi:MAG TPA: esterase [Deltaproteobacteria bacterium]|nr:esterase [Deltaproteobacteria bacterium]